MIVVDFPLSNAQHKDKPRRNHHLKKDKQKALNLGQANSCC